MICPPCSEDDHAGCTNNRIRVSEDELTTEVVEVTKANCTCQHHPHGCPHVLTDRRESDILKPEEVE